MKVRKTIDKARKLASQGKYRHAWKLIYPIVKDVRSSQIKHVSKEINNSLKEIKRLIEDL